MTHNPSQINPNKSYQICKPIKDYQACIKLDLNEFDFDHHPDVAHNIAQTLNKAKSITHYSNCYDTTSVNLIQAIADFNSIDVNSVLLTAGSDDALEYIVNKYVKNTTGVLFFTPTYNYCELLIKRRTTRVFEIPLGFHDTMYDDVSNSLMHCLHTYASEIKDGLVYIVNPNNPLGTLFSTQSIADAVKSFPDTIFVIDEAYIEFCQHASCVDLIQKYENVIITRTFSKAYGLAGLRLGYILAQPQTLQNIKVLYNEKNVTEIAKTAGLTIFQNQQYYQNIIRTCTEIRDDFEQFLAQKNIFFVKSNANFVSFYVGAKKDNLLKTLESNNVYIRDRSNQINMDGFVRVTIGKKSHIDKIKSIINDNNTLFATHCILSLFTPKSHIWKLKCLFKLVIDVLHASDMHDKYWLDSGTLLGAYRNGGIIPWDDDIDIAIDLQHSPLLENLRNSFDQNGLRLKRNRTNCYFQIDFASDTDELHPDKTNDIHVDIFTLQKCHATDTFTNTDPRFVSVDTENARCNIAYTCNDIFPLQQISFYNLTVNIPRNTKHLLTTSVGSNFERTGTIVINNANASKESKFLVVDTIKYTSA